LRGSEAVLVEAEAEAAGADCAGTHCGEGDDRLVQSVIGTLFLPLQRAATP